MFRRVRILEKGVYFSSYNHAGMAPSSPSPSNSINASGSFKPLVVPLSGISVSSSSSSSSSNNNNNQLSSSSNNQSSSKNQLSSNNQSSSKNQLSSNNQSSSILDISPEISKALLECAMSSTKTKLTDEQVKILSETIPLEKIEVRPDGVAYLPIVGYRSILDRAFGVGGWCLLALNGLNIRGNVAFRDFALIAEGKLLAQATGEDTIPYNGDITHIVEVIRGLALARCCKYLGIASELWSPNFMENFKEKHCQVVYDKKGRRQYRKK